MQLSLVTGYWIRILLMFSTHQPLFLQCQDFFGKHCWDSHILWKMNCKEITCLVIFLRWWVQICSTYYLHTYVVRNRDVFPLYFCWWHLIDCSNVSVLSNFNFRLNYSFFFLCIIRVWFKNENNIQSGKSSVCLFQNLNRRNGTKL